MKAIPLAILALSLAACSHVKKDDNGFSRSSVGKDSLLEFYKEEKTDGTTYTYLAVDSNESDSFREGTKTGRTLIRWRGLGKIAGNLFDFLGDSNATDATVEAAKISSDEAVGLAEIEAAQQAAEAAATVTP